MEIIGWILFLVFGGYIWDRLMSMASDQINISQLGSIRVPKLFLKLANISKYEKEEILYKDLGKSEIKKIDEIVEKFHKVSNITLTYLRHQNLIHVSSGTKSSFFQTDKWYKTLYSEEIMRQDEDNYLAFGIYRRKGGISKSPVLVGYLKMENEIGVNEKNEYEVVFEFPEKLINKGFLTGTLEKKFDLKKEVIADYWDKNEFGDPDEIYYTIYNQEGKYPVNFQFRFI
jgi:hypothetical protein